MPFYWPLTGEEVTPLWFWEETMQPIAHLFVIWRKSTGDFDGVVDRPV